MSLVTGHQSFITCHRITAGLAVLAGMTLVTRDEGLVTNNKDIDPKLAAQQFDDKLRRDRQRDILLAGHAGDATFGRVGVGAIQPVGDGLPGRKFQRIDRQLLGVLAVFDGYDVARLHKVAGDVDFATVHGHVTVSNHLASLGTAEGEAELGDDVVEASFENRHQSVARVAGSAAGHLVILAELTFENSVESLDLLFFAEANRIFARFPPAELVHARDAFTAFDSALGGIAASSLQEEFQALAAAESANWSGMASHGFSLG